MITLYRSSNTPIIFSFDIDLGTISELELSLYSDTTYTRLVQKWTKDDVIIQDKYLIVPLKQSETLKFPVGIGHLDLKMLDSSGFVLSARPQSIVIKNLSNLNIMGEDTQIDYDNIDVEELLAQKILRIESMITNIAIIKQEEEEEDEFEALTEQEIDALFEE